MNISLFNPYYLLPIMSFSLLVPLNPSSQQVPLLLSTMYVCLWVSMCVSVCMHVCVCVYLYICMSVHESVCV